MSDEYEPRPQSKRVFGSYGPPRVCIPTYERIKQLYALGCDATQIAQIVNEEMQDIDINPVAPIDVRTMIIDFQEDFAQARQNLTIKCREELAQNTEDLYLRGAEVEIKAADAIATVMGKYAEELAGLNPSEKDELGNYLNSSRIMNILGFLERGQGLLGKIAGTDALRDVEIYRRKTRIKAQEDGNKDAGLVNVNGRESGIVDTKFIQ